MRGKVTRNPATPRSHPVKLLLTPDEAATALGVGKTLLYELLMRNEIASIKVGRARRVPTLALEQFIARQLSELRKGA